MKISVSEAFAGRKFVKMEHEIVDLFRIEFQSLFQTRKRFSCSLEN